MEEQTETQEAPVIQENMRNPDGTFMKGVSGNPAGRPKGTTLKEYQAEKFRQMSNEEKEEYLADVAKVERWRMAEGQPSQGIGQASDLDPIQIQGVEITVRK